MHHWAWCGSEPHLGCQSWNSSALYDLVLKHQLSALLLLCVKSGFSSRQNLISHSEHIRSSLVWWLGFKCWFNADTASLNRSPCSYPMLWSHGRPNDGLGCYRSVWSLHKARLSPGNVQPACFTVLHPEMNDISVLMCSAAALTLWLSPWHSGSVSPASHFVANLFRFLQVFFLIYHVLSRPFHFTLYCNQRHPICLVDVWRYLYAKLTLSKYNWEAPPLLSVVPGQGFVMCCTALFHR